MVGGEERNNERDGMALTAQNTRAVGCLSLSSDRHAYVPNSNATPLMLRYGARMVMHVYEGMHV
jgi:hypothetical protein